MTDQQNFDEEGIEGGDIAIVGIACRFPGADNSGAYWINLRDGHESRVTPSDEELLAAGVTEQELADPDYVKSGMFLDNIECLE